MVSERIRNMLNASGINCTCRSTWKASGEIIEKKQEQEVQIDTGLRHTSHICAWLKDYVWLFCNNQAAQLGG